MHTNACAYDTFYWLIDRQVKDRGGRGVKGKREQLGIRERERERETDRQTDRQTDRDRQRQRDRDRAPLNIYKPTKTVNLLSAFSRTEVPANDTI